MALTQTEKRSTREHKAKYIEEVRDAVDKHKSIYLFSYENMRSSKFKMVRQDFRSAGASRSSSGSMNDDSEEDAGSRIFLGKNKLLQIALGRTTEEEYADNLHHVAKRINGGSVGLLLTSRNPQDVQDYFANLQEPDFARAGATANQEVTITNTQLEPFPVSMMEHFRKCGMPVEIKEGEVILRDGIESYRICKQGEVLSAEKCKVLMQLGYKLSTFKVELVCRWSDGDFELLQLMATDITLHVSI